MILSMLSLYYLTWGPNNLKIFSPSSLRKRSKKEKSAELVVVCCSKRINKKALEAEQAFLPCFFLNCAKFQLCLVWKMGVMKEFQYALANDLTQSANEFRRFFHSSRLRILKYFLHKCILKCLG